MQVKWGNGELNVTFEIGAPTLGSAMIASLAMDHLRRSVTTNGSFGILTLFVNAIRHTHGAQGLPFALLKWNSTSDDIDRVFEAWCGLPEGLGDTWTDAIDQFKGGAAQSGDGNPLSQTGNSASSTNTATPNSTKSEKPTKRQRKSHATTTGLTIPSQSATGG